MQPEDLQRIEAIFAAKGYNYELPSLNQNMLARRVVESGNQIIAGAAARQTSEAFFWVDPTWETPRWRLEALKFIHEEMRVELKEKGITDVHCWIPPEIERAYSRRLLALGWQKQLWTDFVRSI